MDQGSNTSTGLRYVVALAVVLVAAVVPDWLVDPAVLVAAPLLALVGMQGIRSVTGFVVTVLATAFVVMGARDEIWFLVRAWALIAGGSFAALAVAVPHWRLGSKALGSVALSVGAFVLYFAPASGAWSGVEWSAVGTIQAGFQNWTDLIVLSRDGQPLTAEMAGIMAGLAEFTTLVFPARLALQTMAGLAIAWWIYVRVIQRGVTPIGPFREFRFNDHLVWLLIAALAAIALRTGDGPARVGANVAVFMGGLYALRGLAVVVFVNGGLSWLGAGVMAAFFMLLAPFVVGTALLIGIVDTWFDLRARMAATAN